MTRRSVRSVVVRSDAEQVLHDLFMRGLDGDTAAYRTFLQKLSAYLRAFLRKRLFGWPDEVEDLVQECLLAMHNQRHTYQSDQPLTAWVHAIARYKMIDLLRAKSVREDLHDPLDDDLAVFAESAAEAGDARRDLAGLLETLPERQRLPIVHVKIEGLSVAETASLTGMSESAVKIGIHRGLKALAARFRSTT
ncbi:sigma-70 family RNA polymerase sigma factor [Polaromonas sp. P5_D5]